MSRKDRRKAAAQAKAREIAATGRAWTKVQKGLVITRATYRGREVYSLGHKQR